MSGFIGYTTLVKRLKDVGGSPEKVSKRVIKRTVTIAAGDARARAPVGDHKQTDNGGVRLRDTISERVENDGMIGTVVSSASGPRAHVLYNEFGTGQRGAGSPAPPKWDGPLSYRADWPGMAARPFMFPAIEAQREEYPKRMRNSMMREIKKLSKGNSP